MKMTKSPDYIEIPYDDEDYLISPRLSTSVRYYRSSSPSFTSKLFSSNNLVILLLLAFISPSLTTNSSSSIKHEAYFDSNSQIYHLAEDQYKTSINHNFQKLNSTSYYCFKEGTNWNQSIEQNKCVCKSNYSLLDCGLSDQVLKTQLLNRQSSCHFNQDTVNIKRLNKPSKVIFAMPLYECDKRECNKLIDDLVKQYKYIVDLFAFIEIRNSKSTTDQDGSNDLVPKKNMNSSNTVDERIHLYNLNGPNKLGTIDNKRQAASSNSNDQQSKVVKVVVFNEKKKLEQQANVGGDLQSNKNDSDPNLNSNDQSNVQNQTASNVIYQIKTLDLEAITDSKEIVSKVYSSLWNLVLNNVTNYRPTDRIIFVPPFNKVNDKFLNFFKFYYGFGDPAILVDNFFTRTAALFRTRLPKDIQDDLNAMNSAIMFTFQYALSVCKFKFQNFSQNYCLNNPNLVSHFENNYWKICKVTANALYS